MGDRVRVKPGVERPRYGWGNVNRGDVGVVVSLDGQGLAYVNYGPACRYGWPCIDKPRYFSQRSCVMQAATRLALACLPH